MIAHAMRIFRRMTQGEENNDKMSSSIATHYNTQAHPLKANEHIAIIFNYVHE